MQNVATDKSQLAALPQRQSSSQKQAGDNQLFRSFLVSEEPIYRQPVEPKPVNRAQDTDRNTVTASTKQQEATADYNRRQEQIKREEQERRHQEDSRSAAKRPDQSQDTAVESRDGKVTTQSSMDKKDLKNADKVTDKHSDERQATQDKNVKGGTQERVATDKNQDTAKLQGEWSREGEDAQKYVEQKHEQQHTDIDPEHQSIEQQVAKTAHEEIDWLALLQNSQNIKLNRDTGPKDQQKIAEQIAALEKAGVADQEGNLSQELKAMLEQLTALLNGSKSGDNALTKQQWDASLNQLLEKAQGESALPESELQIQEIAESTANSKIEQKVDETLLSLLQLIKQHSGTGEQTEAAPDELIKLVESSDKDDIDASDVSNAILDATATAEASETPSLAETDIDAQDLALLQLVVENKLANQQSEPPTDENVKPTSQEQNNTGIDSNLKALLDLSEQKLDEVLGNLAQRVFPDTAEITDKTSNVDKVVAQLVNPAAESQRKDFVSSLKAGLEEVKAQLKQGHQSAIDLNSLVAQSMVAMKEADVSIERATQVAQQFSSALELGTQLNKMTDPAAIGASLERISSRESNSSTAVASKQVHQQMQQFDKAVNITRNEGHQQFVEKVRWMVNQNNLQADIRLDPPDLGSMKVRVNLSGDTASVSIVVQSQQARDVLEQASPRLKELLEQQGIELGQSSVEQEQQSAQQQSGQGSAVASHGFSDEQEDDTSQIIEQPIIAGRPGGIDYFV